ncbi:MAG TPA: glycosyltransferase [Bacteroidales bacterium]|nr:glycosyltransferase [Bacteroidales bacterium]
MKELQVIAFNVPYPPDYGGVIDVYYKLKALKEAGIAITLHCFDYGRGEAVELEQWCQKVFYYPRSRSLIKQFSSLPFIVKTRDNKLLIENLSWLTHVPILAEGLHCTFPLYYGKCNNDIFYVRTHNIEHAYYKGLKITENNYFKKIYYSIESKKLKQYEPILKNAKGICSISQKETEYFSDLNANTILISPFHPFQKVEIREGIGDYILVHGDLSVAENINSAQWLINKVFSQIKYNVIIAGKNPHSSIVSAIKKFEHIRLVANPSFDKMQELIANAQIHIVHSFTPQGMKLKLLNIMYNGRHCICNNSIVVKTGFENLCEIANNENEMLISINKLIKIPFEKRTIKLREEVLSLYSNSVQALNLIEFLKLK